jgi:hypothetical protein
MGKSKCSYALSEKPYFYDLENRILWDAEAEILKHMKPGRSPENRDEWDPYLYDSFLIVLVLAAPAAILMNLTFAVSEGLL